MDGLTDIGYCEAAYVYCTFDRLVMFFMFSIFCVLLISPQLQVMRADELTVTPPQHTEAQLHSTQSLYTLFDF